jgi:hypothetical protein
LPFVAVRPPRIKAADLVEVRASDSTDKRRERLERWAIEEMRNGCAEGLDPKALGKRIGRCVFRFKGTYGDLPPKELVDHAYRAAWAMKRADDERGRAKREPLFARGA